jgi:hypothetical protein
MDANAIFALAVFLGLPALVLVFALRARRGVSRAQLARRLREVEEVVVLQDERITRLEQALAQPPLYRVQ